MEGVEDQVLALVGSGMAGDDIAATADDHLIHVTAKPNLLIPIGHGHRVIVVPVAHQGERVDLRWNLLAGFEGRRWQLHQSLLIAYKAFIDARAMAAQDILSPSTAAS